MMTQMSANAWLNTKGLNTNKNAELNIVKIEEVAYLREKVRAAVRVYEDQLGPIFFRDPHINMDGFINRVEDKFWLSTEEAVLLSRYLFERRNKPKVVFDKSTSRRTHFILRRLKEFVGKYEKIETDDVDNLRTEYQAVADAKIKLDFVKGLKNLVLSDYSTPFDITNLVSRLGININANSLIVYLWRMSQSIVKIKSAILKHLIKTVYSDKKNARLAFGLLAFPSRHINQNTSRDDPDENMDSETKLEIGGEFLTSLAEYLNTNELSILSIIHSKIFDKVMNAKEHQLIKYKHFYQLVGYHKFDISNKQKIAIQHIVPPFLNNTIDLTSLIYTLSKYGNVEPFPLSNQHIQYNSKHSNLTFSYDWPHYPAFQQDFELHEGRTNRR